MNFMTHINFEIILGNVSFILLFGAMLFYWVEASFSFFSRFHFIAFSTTIFANFSILLLLSIRWINYGHFPLSNMYESLIFLSWSLILLQIVLEKMSKNTLLGAIITPIAFFTNSFASFFLPKEMQKASVLVPALQSNWLMMHVTVMMLSYAALLVGSLLAIAFLFITFGKNIDLTGNSLGRVYNNSTNAIDSRREFVDPSSEVLQYETKNTKQFLATVSNSIPENFIQEQNLFQNSLFSSNQNIKGYFMNQKAIDYKLAKLLDNLSYRTLGIGFPLLTIGILSGAVWANEAWGSYWSWDPKETWALITWLIFAIYLHTRITKGWQGKKPAIIASAGFFIVWICYLGVNLLGKGLHSYGWVHFNF
jgi:cytochrome c-type biogenesis protein CcsB